MLGEPTLTIIVMVVLQNLLRMSGDPWDPSDGWSSGPDRSNWRAVLVNYFFLLLVAVLALVNQPTLNIWLVSGRQLARAKHTDLDCAVPSQGLEASFRQSCCLRADLLKDSSVLLRGRGLPSSAVAFRHKLFRVKRGTRPWLRAEIVGWGAHVLPELWVRDQILPLVGYIKALLDQAVEFTTLERLPVESLRYDCTCLRQITGRLHPSQERLLSLLVRAQRVFLLLGRSDLEVFQLAVQDVEGVLRGEVAHPIRCLETLLGLLATASVREELDVVLFERDSIILIV
mmetsp:Transcript_10339/g.15868  ORF Transcript_10339/g.15868 Transcript_10339/m.15868 type:complete len:286 (-) Transcript_10339:1463-2320(-)